ncbi:hypothetical protein [Clostridium sp.]
MMVKVMNRMYRMSRKEYQGLLEVARQQVQQGVYAIEKSDYAELRCDKCQSVTQLKALIRQFKGVGYKVYSNREKGEESAADASAGGTNGR